MIGHVRSEISRRQLKSFIDRPSKIHARAGDYAQPFPGNIANLSDIQRSGISVGSIVTASPRPQGEPKGLPQSQGPDPRARRAWVGWIVKWIARDAVAGQWVQTKDLAVERIDHLTTERSNVFLRLNDSFGQRLLIIRSRLASVIAQFRAITARGQECAIRPEDQRADTMRVKQNGNSRAGRFTQKNCPTGRINSVKIIGSVRGVTSDSANGRVVVFVCSGVIIGGAELTKIGMEGEPKQAMIAPVADLVADVDERRREPGVILKNPNTAIAVPLVHGSRIVESNTDRAFPITANFRLDETGRKRRSRAARSAQKKQTRAKCQPEDSSPLAEL